MADASLFYSVAVRLLSLGKENWLAFLLFLFLAQLVYARYFHPLSNVPGPVLASTSRCWLLWVTLEGKQHIRYIEAHKRYGPIVRIKSNTVIISNPRFLQANYFAWDKSDWWLAFRSDPHDVPHGNELQVEAHKSKKQKVMGGFTLSSILKNEGQMSVHIAKLKGHLSRLADTNTVFDLAPWMHYTAFDIVMEMLFSNPPGFLEKGTDVGGLIGSLHGMMTAASIMTTFPIFPQMIRNPWINPLLAPGPTDKTGPGAIHGLAKAQVQQRLAPSKNSIEGRKDVLQWVVDHTDCSGQHMTAEMLEKEALDQVFAGSDTTSASMRAIILHVATNPRVLNKLVGEITRADESGLLSKPVARFEEIKQQIPYIESIFKEGLRIYPIVGAPLYRKVPKPGIHFDGHFLPAGTEVGMSQWAVARNPQVWGPDVDVFRPERWTETTNAESAAARRQGDIFFGNGIMMCTGRNLAMMEVYKVIVEFFRNFDVTIVNPIRPWKEKNSLAMLHWDFFVTLAHRHNAE